MKKIICVAVAVALCLATAGITNAAITNVRSVPVDNSAGGAALDGYVTCDILISFEGQYTGAQILFDTGSEGGIFQDAAGGKTPPNENVVGALPALGFDTFVAQGSATSPGSDGEPAPGGGAVDLGGDSVAVFDGQQINQAFNPAGGQIIEDRSDFLIARISIRNDVTQLGSLHLLASAGGVRTSLSLPIFNGFCIPEPSSIVLGTFGILSIVSWRRRS